ncbi:MAG TPA: cytochrome c oxidase assembly protein [Actinomycetes bacterium]
MSVLFEHWSFDPVVVVMAVVVGIHQRGLRLRLHAVRRAGRPTRPWVGQAALFYLGLAALLLAIVSPIDYWADDYLTAHVVQHILLSFVAAPLIVLGAPWLPLLRGLPRPVRGGFGRLAQRTRPGRPVGPVGRALAWVRQVLARPWTSIVLFNAAMLFWHFPGPFDLAARVSSVHIWLEHGSFFGLAVALWLQIFGSYPMRPVLDGPRRLAALISTNGVMVVVAMTLVMFTKDLYPWYAEGHTLAQQAADQQIAGAILWVCGEIAFFPAMHHTVTSWLREREPDPIPLLAPVAG